MCTDHVNSTSTLSTTVYTMPLFFLLIFPDFIIIFMFITILGNMHRLCKLYPNIVNNSLQCVYSFSLDFSDFLVIFPFIAILGNAHRPCKQYTNILDNGLHLPLPFFLLFFSWFSAYIYINYYVRKCMPCKLYLNIINNATSCLSFVFLLFFSPDFLVIFVLITILWNVHRSCKQYPNILTTTPIQWRLKEMRPPWMA